ncbi:MAG: hypothetical protein IH989_06505 [Planctomycetes bacterium]|nr:hypothetical protein [Planctomycetota bacterium]
MNLDEEDITSKDRFRCRAELRLRISLVPERGELVSFLSGVVGSHRVVQAAGLSRFIEPEIRTTLAAVASQRDAADLVSGGCAKDFANAIADALKPLLFSAGMILSAAPVVRFESDTVRAVQETQQRAAQEKAEHDAARQVQLALEKAQSGHLDHLADLLARLKELAAKSPGVELPELIRTFAERERGEVYEALFGSQTPTTQTQWIVVAAGDELLFIDPMNLETPRRRLAVSGEAGPVRSIQTVEGGKGPPVLWLGASTGVYRWPIDRNEPDLTLAVENAPKVQGGFNAVASIGDRVFASHSELGLIAWNLAEPGDGRRLFESMTREAKAVRAVCCFDGEMYCSIDDRVICTPVDQSGDLPARIYTGSASTITSICPTYDGLFAGNGNGDVLHWPSERDTNPERLHTGAHRATESVWHIATDGVKRLIFADTSLHIHARVLGDTYACRYEAGGQTLRRVEIAPDLLVATNDLRDRLICWTPGEPAKPSGVIAISRLTGRSIQDVCLVAKV